MAGVRLEMLRRKAIGESECPSVTPQSGWASKERIEYGDATRCDDSQGQKYLFP